MNKMIKNIMNKMIKNNHTKIEVVIFICKIKTLKNKLILSDYFKKYHFYYSKFFPKIHIDK